MRNKKLIWIVLLALVLATAIVFVACKPDEQNDDVWTIERVYARAQELGYQGTLDELIEQFRGADGENGTDGKDGKDGVGIKTIEINADGELIVTLTDGTELNLGVVVGAAGPQGPQGPTGPQGPQGPSGQDATQNDVHTFTVTFVAEGHEAGKVVCLDGTTVVAEPAVPQKEHYTGRWESYTLANADITVQAVYTPTEYSVVFAGNGQQEVRTYTVETKDDVTPPEVPAKEHYTGAWPQYELQFEQNQIVNAVYTPIEYTITFDDGAKQTKVTYTAETMAEIAPPDITPKTEQYYGFSYDEGRWEQFDCEFDNEQVVYAVYSLVTPGYTYTLNDDGQSYSLTNVSAELADAIVLPYYNDLPVTNIGEYALSGRFQLISITIASNVASIDDFAFSKCTSLETITFEGDSHLQTIGNRAFFDCEQLLSITIPDGVTSIGDYAFLGCGSLQTVTFESESQLQNIGEHAFSDCGSLQEITLATDHLQNIGDYAFYRCGQSEKLTSITIPSSVTNIGICAFSEWDNLQTITFEGSSQLQSIGHCAFMSCTRLQTVTFEGTSQLQSIGNQAFDGCYELPSITIPGSVTYIGECAFSDCWELQTVTFEDDSQLQSMGYGIFFRCSQLSSIKIPDTVTEIGEQAFMSCSNLSSIFIPSSVTDIGKYAFDLCSNLTTIVIPSSVTSIGDGAFAECCNLENIEVHPDNPVYHCTNNCLIETASHTLVVGCKNSTIPDDGSVTIIGAFAFSGCKDLEAITIPSCVTSIGVGAFESCSSLKSIVIPRSVTSIGDGAFANCSSLQTVTFEGDSQLQNIGTGAFSDCSSLVSIAIPSGVTSIGAWVFYNCKSLTSITIPSSVTNIGDSAFNDCYNLTIYCEATSKPAGWHKDWNIDNCPVVWGYKQQ